MVKLIVFVGIFTFAHAIPLENLVSKCKILDLSYEYNSETIYWPNNDPFKKEVVEKGRPNGFYYETFKFCTAEHSGTHLDAPAHFNENGKSVEQLSLQTFIGEAFVVNIREKAKKNRDYVLSVADLEDYENSNGRIENGAILIVNTGYGAYWPNRTAYMGSDVPKDVSHLHFPGVSEAAANWLVSNRSIGVLGIDTASMDPGTSTNFIVHQIVAAKNVSGFENLRNVDKLPPRGATIIGLPMSITGGSGGPLRAFAVGWDGPNDPCRRGATNGADRYGSNLFYYVVAFLILKKKLIFWCDF